MRKIFIILLMALALTACSSKPENDDPRKGKVVTDRYDCMLNSCYEAYNICQGPDLVYIDNRLEKDELRIENAPECER